MLGSGEESVSSVEMGLNVKSGYVQGRFKRGVEVDADLR